MMAASTALSFDVGTRTLSLCVVTQAAAPGGCDSAAQKQQQHPELSVREWRVIDLHGEEKGLTMHQLSERCVEALLSLGLLEKYKPDTVIIETQRAGQFGNATMVAISHVLHAFALTSARLMHMPLSVSFVSPTLKLVAAAKLLGLKPPSEEEEVAAVAAPPVVVLEGGEGEQEATLVPSTEEGAKPEPTDRQRNYAFYKKNKKASKDSVAKLLSGERALACTLRPRARKSTPRLKRRTTWQTA